jgi:hypothetical protein
MHISECRLQKVHIPLYSANLPYFAFDKNGGVMALLPHKTPQLCRELQSARLSSLMRAFPRDFQCFFFPLSKIVCGTELAPSWQQLRDLVIADKVSIVCHNICIPGIALQERFALRVLDICVDLQLLFLVVALKVRHLPHPDTDGLEASLQQTLVNFWNGPSALDKKESLSDSLKGILLHTKPGLHAEVR